MSRTSLNLLIDSLLLLGFVTLVGCAVIVRFVFPPGPDAKGWLLWGATYNQWTTLHFALLAVFAFGILLHLMLHWSWVCGVVATRLARDKKAKLDEGVQTLYGVALLIAILNLIGLLIAFAAISIQRPP